MQFKDGLAGDYSVFASGFAGAMVEPEGALTARRPRAGTGRRCVSERRQGRPHLEDHV